MNEDSLDLDSVQVTSTAEVHSEGSLTALVLGVMLLMAVLMTASAWWSIRQGKQHPGRSPLRLLSDLPPPVGLLAALTVLLLFVVQAVAVLDVYQQTTSVHPDTWEYFQYVSWVRLLGMSHVHLFGYTVMYGLLGFLLTLTRASERLKSVLISGMLWAGLFDVVSWWGLKALTAKFDWLTMSTGAISGTCSLIAGLFVIREVFSKGAWKS